MQRNSESRRFEIQARKAEVIDISKHRAKVVAPQALVNRFRAVGIRKVALEAGLPEREVENVLRERIDYGRPRAA